MFTDYGYDAESREHKIELENGNQVIFKASDPYGFWTIHYAKGQVPAMLKGQFTTQKMAEAAFMAYVNSRSLVKVKTETTESEEK